MNDSYVRVRISILKGRDLPAMDRKSSDPYVMVKLQDAILFKSNACPATLNPVWNDEVATIDRIRPQDLEKISFEVWDSDVIGKDDFMGMCKMPDHYKSSETTTTHEPEWIVLHGLGASKEVRGQLQIGVEIAPVHFAMEGLVQRKGHALSLEKCLLVLYDKPEPMIGLFQNDLCCAKKMIHLATKKVECYSRGCGIFALRKPSMNEEVFVCQSEEESRKWLEAIGKYCILCKGPAPSQKQSKKEGFQFFGLSIQDLVKRNEFGPDMTTLPKVLEFLFDDVRKRGSSCEGVFRISANAKNVRLAEERFSKSGKAEDLVLPEDVPHLAAALIKQFFRTLPEPVFPFAVYDECVRIIAQEDAHSVLRDFQKIVNDKLPVANKTLLSHLFKLLKDISTNHVAETHMTASNFGIVFGPSLLWPQNGDAMMILKDTGAVIGVVEFFVVHCDELFGSESSKPDAAPTIAAGKLVRWNGSMNLQKPKINYDEIFSAVDASNSELVSNQAKRLFRAYDSNGDGYLNLEEFVAFFMDLIQHAHLEPFSREGIRVLLETLSEGDMVITLDQFLVWWADFNYNLNNQTTD